MASRGGAGGALSLTAALAVAGTLVVGTGLGFALQQTGALGSDSEGAAVALDVVPYVGCPDGGDGGQLVRSDRVLATGRDSSGEWIEIRSPADLGERAWVRTKYLIPDADLGGLPVHQCAQSEGTTTTTLAGATTTAPGAVTTKPPTTGTTRAPTTTTTKPLPTDTTGPSISGVSAVPSTIYEADSAGDKCSIDGSFATKSTVGANISDASGIQSVTMTWQVASTSGSKAMTESGAYQATLGAFPASTIPQSTSASIAVTITAIDTRGNTSTAPISVTLKDCTFT